MPASQGPEFGIGRVVHNGVALGLAFAVGGRALLTCAHVVNEALGRAARETGAPAADERLLLEFPFGGGPDDTPVRYATVAMWGPAHGAFGQHDLAGLLLQDDPPPGLTALRLADRPERGGTVVQVWGPGRGWDGIGGAHVEAVLAGAVDHGRYQLEQRTEGTFRAGAGFSGGPVWTQAEHRVAGVLCAATSPADGADAYLIGVEVAVACWPEVLYRAPPCPYRGLGAFGPDDAALFFGRDKVVADLAEQAGRLPVVTVMGPSGSGKSSVIAAGLVAELGRRATLTHLMIRPGRGVLSALAAAFAARTSATRPIPPADLEMWERRLAERGLGDAMRTLRASVGDEQVVVVVDQFEQILDADHPAGQRQTFLRLLAELAAEPRDPGGLVAISLRHDLLGQLIAENRDFGPYLQRTATMLYPLAAEELHAAVVEPARLADAVRPVLVEPNLVAQIVEDFSGQAGELPLVQFALTRLWQRLRGPRLTLDGYVELGGARTALTSFADECVDRLPAEQQDVARLVFGKLGVTDGIGLGRRMLRTEFPAEHWETAERLAGPDARLLVIGGDSFAGVEYVEIAHEILLRAWPRLRKWLAADREFLMWLRKTGESFREWTEHRQDDQLLLPEPLLDRAERLLAEREAETRHLRAYILASRDHASRDPLTGLSNRPTLLQALSDALRQRRADQVVAVFVVDICRVRDVNRYAGHAAGDILITSVGQHLPEVAPLAAAVGRLGGDEFGIVARFPDVTAATDAADEIRSALHGSMTIADQMFEVDVTIGVAVHPPHGGEPETLLQHASTANHLASDRAVPVQLFESFELGTELRLELAGAAEAIKVYYQPVVDLRTGSVVALEASPQWEKRSLPAIGPEVLLPLVDQTQQAERLTEILLTAATRDMGTLPGVGLSVDISTALFADERAMGRIVRMLNPFREMITVAVPETMVMPDQRDLLVPLRRLGVRLAIADFGMGYSSLSYLRDAPIDELKIHRSFVQAMETSAQQLTLVGGIVSLAHSLGIRVVAEGVDTAAIAGLLRECGCDSGQGRYFAEPMPFAEAKNWPRGH